MDFLKENLTLLLRRKISLFFLLLHIDLRGAGSQNLKSDDEFSRFSEPGVKQSVDQRVQEGVKVEENEGERRRLELGLLPCLGDRKIRAEADQESQPDESQSSGRFEFRLLQSDSGRAVNGASAHGSNLRHGHHKHPDVQNQHHRHRPDEEEQNIHQPRKLVENNHALPLAGVMTAGLLQVVLHHEEDAEEGEDPAARHRDANSPLRHLHGVPKRLADRHVTVDRYEHHRLHRGRGDNVVHNIIGHTHDVTKKPAAVYEQDLKDHQEAHKEV